MPTPCRWVVRDPPDPARVAALADRLRLPPALASLLVQRGYVDPEQAARFLRPSLQALSDPFALPDMTRAVEILAAAVTRGETILVHGDYDVDGQCGTALLVRTLRAAGARVVPFVPHRLYDGYDFGPAGLAAAAHHGAAVIVTCDCGTTATEAVAQAAAQGRRVIVTDHHLPGVLPPAHAVVNPRRADSEPPYRDFCGAGVAFKLAQALAGALGLPANFPYHLLDLVALATVADLVPLTGENRTLVKFGLKLLGESRWPGLRALIEAAGLAGRPLTAGRVGYILAPRLNAIGRIGDANLGLRLLLTDDPEEARSLARELEMVNGRRQSLDQAILEQALAHIEREVNLEEAYGLVLAREGWHPGVIGIVASRLVERFGRPTVLVALEGEQGRGSGRSVPGFDLHRALVACAPHLARFGGHPMAAGLLLRRERLEDFAQAFNAAARAALAPEDLVPVQRIDLLVRLDQLDLRLERLLQALEPCGPGNPAPVFGVVGARAVRPRVVGSNHLRFLLDDGTARLAAIGFDWADRVSADWSERPVKVAFRLDRDEWQGDASLEARVVDLQLAT